MAESRARNVCAYPWQQMNIDLTGEVVPCCFWTGYGNSGRALGNTNAQTLDEIWNGSEYRELRRANAEGLTEGHPCHKCLAWTWGGGNYPGFSWPGFRAETGRCWQTPIPESFREAVAGLGLPVRLHEDGRPLPHPDALHDEIRNLGAGRYSVWGDTLYFAPPDDSDPRRNGRTYELVCGEQRRALASVVLDSVSGRNVMVASAEYEAGAEVMEARPTLISFISTSDCNIDCPACSQNLVRLLRVQHRPETEADVLAHVPYLFQFIWHGGEPFLIKGFQRFLATYERRDNPNLTFGFTSNGTLLDEATLARLDKFPRLNASISVDSFVEDTFHVIREGANFGLVLRNLLRAMALHDAPDRILSVGMIVNKLNLLELPRNLQFAMDHGIGMNLSPVVVVPVFDRLDIFSDFPAQTAGWREALREAREVVERARAAGAVALRRVDPRGMLDALEAILDRAAARYADTWELRVEVSDPHGSLPKMKHPGLIVIQGDGQSTPLTYCELAGAGSVVLRLPRAELSGRTVVYWDLVHDLDEAMGVIERDVLRDELGVPADESGFAVLPTLLQLEVPRFDPVQRSTRNAQVANWGLPTADGLPVLRADAMYWAYLELMSRDLGAPRGTPVDCGTAVELHRRFRGTPKHRYGGFVRVHGQPEPADVPVPGRVAWVWRKLLHKLRVRLTKGRSLPQHPA